MAHLRGATLLAVALLTTTPPVLAQAPLKNLSLEELANVEVTTASKLPERVLDTPAALHVITGEDIRRSGVTTLPDALRLAPGVIVSQSDANRWAVGVRGFADLFSKNVLVLIDGRSVYTPLVGGVHWAVQDLVLADVDRIEVIRGPGASVWGANAVNGVINVITKSAEATQGLRITAAGGNVEQGRLSARWGSKAGLVDYRVHAKAFTRGAQFHSDNADFDAWQSVQGGFRADWRRSSRETLTLSGDVYRTDVGERAQVSYFEPPSISDIDGTVNLTGGNVRVAWQHNFLDGAQYSVEAYYDRTDRRGFTFTEVRDTFDIDVNLHLAPIARHQLSFGVNGRVSPSRFGQVVPTLRMDPPRHTYRSVSAFVHEDFALFKDRLTVGGGVKVEHNTYSGAELMPSAQATWTPRARHRVWGAVTRAVRTPSRFERDLRFHLLADASIPAYVLIQGSSEFSSESIVGSEIGYRTVLGPTFFIDVVGFVNEHTGLAAFGNRSAGVSVEPITFVAVAIPFVNGIEGRSNGVEIAPDWKVAGNWRVSGSYSYFRTALRDRERLANTGLRSNYEGGSPRHQVRVQSRIDLSDAVQFDQTYRFVSELPHWHVPAYHGLDLRVGWRVNALAEFSIVGQNLLQPHHAEFGAVPVQIRRAAFAQITLTR